MPSTLTSITPEHRSFVGVNTALIAIYSVEANATGRALALKVDGVTVLQWDGTTTVVNAGFTGSVVLSGTTLTVTLTKDGGWAHATGVLWSVGYSDSVTTSVQRESRFIYLTESQDIEEPPGGTRTVSRRTWIMTGASVSGGALVGMDLQINGVNAVDEGVAQTPAFEGTQGVSGTIGYAVVRPRRFFNFGQTVVVRARVRVSVSGVVYRGSLSRTLVVVEEPLRLSARTDVPPSSHPLFETMRQVVEGSLRPSPNSPNLGSLLPYYVRRTEIGGLARRLIAGAPDPGASDIPSYATLRDLVERVAPLWPAFVNECAVTSEKVTLLDAWRSGDTLERIGAICVILMPRT